MHLRDIIDTLEDQEGIWIAYPESKTFQVKIRYLGNKAQEFLEKSRKVEWDETTMERKVVFDNEAYGKLFNAHVIETWKGLYISDLKKMVPLKYSKIKGYQGEIACDELSKMLLMTHSPSFNRFINRVCVDIERFNQEKETEELKNSGSSSATD